MSRKGDGWDNALTESFFNTLKSERVHATRYQMHQASKTDLFEYIEVFYNNRSRRQSSLGFVSPKAFFGTGSRLSRPRARRINPLPLKRKKPTEAHFRRNGGRTACSEVTARLTSGQRVCARRSPQVDNRIRRPKSEQTSDRLKQCRRIASWHDESHHHSRRNGTDTVAASSGRADSIPA